jgi:hypothetical protein
MKLLLKIVPLMLALGLLAGCGEPAVTDATTLPQSAPAHSGTIAYVPLDDRPDNAERVAYLAESLGYELKEPKPDLYKTSLDGQPLNANGTRYGDRAALYEWVLEQEAAGCDLYVLSLDQLLSGGLVNSRHMTCSEPVALSDGSSLSEQDLLAALLKTLSADPNNVVWLLDTVMRLAPTVGYAGFGLNEYNALRTYGMAPRPALTGDALSVENIVADYTVGVDGKPIACSSDAPLPSGAAQDYLKARERKLRLSDAVEKLLSQPGYENFHLLVGIDDSSAEDSIQKNEIAYLRAGLRAGQDGVVQDALLSGVDDLGFKAVTRLYLDRIGWRGAEASVVYFGGSEEKPACDYDYQPLTDIVREHLAFFGLTENASGEGDLQVLVLTQPAEGVQAADACGSLIRQLNKNEKEGLPTVLIDAGNGTYGTSFHDALVKQCHLGWLLSYSGFLDMAIVTGTALSHGVARYAWLKYGTPLDADAGKAFARTLTDSIVKDFCYRNTVREDLVSYVRDTLNGSPDNFWQPAIDENAVRLRLRDGMDDGSAAVLKNFASSNLIASLEPYAELGWGKLTLTDFSFPWDRVFEIRMTIGVGSFASPHRLN